MEFTQQLMFILALVILTFISAYTSKNRKVLGAYPLLIHIIILIAWTLSCFFEFNSYNLQGKLLWRNIEQLGVFLSPVALLFFSLDYSKQIQLKKYAYAYTIVPVTSLVLIFTDNYHHIMRLGYGIVDNSTFGRALVVHSTAVGMIFLGLNFCVPILVILIFLDFARRVSKHYRKRVFTVIISLLLILFTTWLKMAYFEKHNIFIYFSELYMPSELILFFSIFRYKLFSLSPIARDKVFDVINQGILVVDLDGNIVDVNSYAAMILKGNLNIDKELLGANLHEIFIEEKQIPQLVSNCLKSTDEIEIMNKAGNYFSFTVLQLLSDSEDKIGSVILINDTTEKKNYELYLKEKAYNDSLTRLLNRNGFKNALDKIISITDTSKQLISIFMIDIDMFKNINDTYGHINGDKVLQHLAKILEEELRCQDAIGRLGGEEFSIILPEITKYEAFKVAERIRKKIENSIVLAQDDKHIKYSISIGVNDNYNSEGNFDILLHYADTALYEAKNKSRNCTVVYN